MFKHRSYYSLKFKARRLSKFYKKNFSRRIFKIKLSAFNKKFIRNMRRFKFINFDNMKKGLYSSIRKKMRLSLSRNIRLR